MKRSGPIARKTPMRRTQSPSGGTLARSARISPKRKVPRRRPVPQWTWEEWRQAGMVLSDRSGDKCERCGIPYNQQFERHHRKRRRDGGDRLCNILLLCRDCHQHVTEHPLEARRYGFIVSVSSEPDVIPVLYRRREWMILDDAGSVMPLPFPVEDAHG